MFLLSFLLCGIVTARFLDRRRMRIASVTHAVAFCLLLLYFLWMPDIGFAAQGKRESGGFFGFFLQPVLTGTVGLIEIAIWAVDLAFFIGLAVRCARRFGERVRKFPSPERRLPASKGEPVFRRRPCWLLFCRLLC